MIKTFLKTKKGESIKTGNVEIQSKIQIKSSPGDDLQKVNFETPSSAIRRIVTETSNSSQVFEKRGSNSNSSRSFRDNIETKIDGQRKAAEAIKENSRDRISSILSNNFDKTIINSIIGAGNNSILPDFGNINDLKPEMTLPDSIIESQNTAQPTTPYEESIGIAQDNAEFVMAIDFKPLFFPSSPTENEIEAFDDTSLLTPEGKLFREFINARLLHWLSLEELFAIRNSYINSAEQIIDSNFRSFFNEAQSTARYLINLNSSIEIFKRQLDLRDSFHQISPKNIIQSHISSYPYENDFLNQQVDAFLGSGFIPSKFSVPNALESLGYSSDNIKYSYTNTKIWNQLLHELREMLLTHSWNLLGINTVDYKGDISSTAIYKPNSFNKFNFPNRERDYSLSFISNKFLVNAVVPDNGSMPILFSIEDSIKAMAPLVSQEINFGSSNLYTVLNFANNETKIASILNAITKEFRYSQNLKKDITRENLLDNYGVVVDTDGDNRGIFDFIIGNIGQNITDFKLQNKNSVNSITYNKINDANYVLSLEPRKIEGGIFTAVPGSQFYADSIFDVNVEQKTLNPANLIVFGDRIRSVEKALNVAISDLDLFSLPGDPGGSGFGIYSNTARFLKNSILFFDFIRSKFFDGYGNLLEKFNNDFTLGIFSFSNKNYKTKNALFLIVALHILRERYESQPRTSETELFLNFFDVILNESVTNLINSLLAEVDTSIIDTDVNADDSLLMSATEIRAKLSSAEFGSETLKEIIFILKDADYAFSNLVMQDSSPKTIFSGITDLQFHMAIFDVFTTMLSAYGNQQICAANTSAVEINDLIESSLFFQVKKSQNSNRNALMSISQKIRSEILTSQKTLATVLGTLQNLLTSVERLKYVSEWVSLRQDIIPNVIDILGGDENLIKLFLNDGQIKVFANCVADVVSILNSNRQFSLDANNDGTFNDSDYFKILDESVIFPKMKKQLEDFFKLPQFVEPSASNLKIFSVGLPIGFLNLLREKIDVSSTKRESVYQFQNDVVKIKLYKLDILNPDIVFKPKEYLFELSRFPVRNESLIRNADNQPSDILSIAEKFPTRDYLNTFTDGGAEVQYFGPNDTALQGDIYPYLTKEQKEEIYTNHVTSYLLESYTRIMTSLSPAEHNISVIDPPSLVEQNFVQDLIKSYILKISQSGNVRPAANPLGILDNSQIVPVANQFLQNQQIPVETSENLLNQIDFSDSTLAFAIDAGAVFTNQSNPLAAVRKLMIPKIFDRVFNIVVDPNSFEIDRERTEATPLGTAALQAMIINGDVIQKNDSSLGLQYRERFVEQGELMFEKYFVAIETLDDAER